LNRWEGDRTLVIRVTRIEFEPEVAGASPARSDRMPGSAWCARPGDGDDRRPPDYAGRLRDAFHDASLQALICREDAMGAAAEIEQLWAAVWIMAGHRNADIPVHCRDGAEAVDV
jgi:hypothetical protein